MHDKLFNPDYLYSLCKNYGLQPSKKYGQNFLINPEVIGKMVDTAGIKKSDTVVEVGPGFGVLTFALAEKAKQVISFEIEKKLEDYWREKKPVNVEVRWGNVLKQVGDLPAWKYVVVANLPYQITSAVIRAFLEADNPPESMILMVQKEVAERICAQPGDMSLLAVAVQYYAEAEMAGMVSRDDFWPAPKVDSAIIKLTIKKRGPDAPAEVAAFFHLVKIGFANRRKMLLKNLTPLVGKKNLPELKKIFSQLSIRETARAQELSLGEWQALAKHIVKLYE